MSNQTTTDVDTKNLGSALKEISRRLKELEKENKDVLITDNQGDYCWIDKEGYFANFDLKSYYEKPLSLVFEEMQKRKDDNNFLENDIEALKKRIKYAKTPMERKQLSKQLNAAYKKRKKK